MIMRAKLNNLWTAEENDRLLRMIDCGNSPFRAAAVLKRSLAGVQNQARKLGKPFPNLFDQKRALRSKIAAAERVGTIS